jgi:hypothetical protein
MLEERIVAGRLVRCVTNYCPGMRRLWIIG